MKKDLIIFAVLTIVASTFLNANASSHSKDNLALAKTRIEGAVKTYAKSQTIETVATTKTLEKPNEG